MRIPDVYDPFQHTVRTAGLDLGQAEDPSALAVVSRFQYGPQFVGPRQEDKFRVTALRRWPVGTSYCDVADEVLALHLECVVVDYGGVGRAVVDYLRKRARELGYRGKLIPIQSVGGNARPIGKRAPQGTYLSVPKIDLIGAINVALATFGIILPSDHPDCKQLIDEIKTVKLKYTAKGNETFDHRGPGHHGDMAMALCLACYWLLKGNRRLEAM
jgi:hypothetical protein